MVGSGAPASWNDSVSETGSFDGSTTLGSGGGSAPKEMEARTNCVLTARLARPDAVEVDEEARSAAPLPASVAPDADGDPADGDEFVLPGPALTVVLTVADAA
jgi:hypothetical protein